MNVRCLHYVPLSKSREQRAVYFLMHSCVALPKRNWFFSCFNNRLLKELYIHNSWTLSYDSTAGRHNYVHYLSYPLQILLFHANIYICFDSIFHIAVVSLPWNLEINFQTKAKKSLLHLINTSNQKTNFFHSLMTAFVIS